MGKVANMSAEYNELLTEERVFCHKFGLESHKVCKGPQLERDGIWFGPGDEALVKRLVTKACQQFDAGENPKHSVCYPFVKMSR